jgi:splicing suppressor protein 51
MATFELATSADFVPVCVNCGKTAAAASIKDLKRCNRCKVVPYCNRACQIANYQSHKKVCRELIALSTWLEGLKKHRGTYTSARLKDLDKHVDKPFSRLRWGTYLHDRPVEDVYKLLIDAYRLFLADDVDFHQVTTPNSVYTGAPSSIEPFRKFLDDAATRPGLLPPWWDSGMKRECETFGESGAWQDLRCRVTKHALEEHYGDRAVVMQLRVLANVACGRLEKNQDVVGQLIVLENGGAANGPGMGSFLAK